MTKFSPRDSFRVMDSSSIIDYLQNEMDRRGQVYSDVSEKFSFLNNFKLSKQEYHTAISKLVDFYCNDMENFYFELVQFQSYVKFKFNNERKVFSHGELYEIILNNETSSKCRNCASHFLTLMITNCSAEHSFFQLK